MGKKLSIPRPARYFKLFIPLLDKQTDENFKKEVDDSVMQKYNDIWELDKEEDEANELLSIYHFKWKETLYFMYQSKLYLNNKLQSELKSLTQNNKPKKDKKKKKKKKSKKKVKEDLEEPICYDLLQKWRDICRDWPSLIYAYAIPTRKAIELMKKYSPLVEMGAGTGYWINLLRKENIDIIGFDLIPPAVSGIQNEFHANTKPFVDDIRISTTSTMCKYSNRTLLLCFPPPDDNMALEFLKAFKGDTFIHIGEWYGFTGTIEFVKELLNNWNLVERLELPNWADTEYDMTVWKRKDPNDNSLTELLECSECGKKSPSIVLRQCKCCRYLIKMIFTEDIDKELDFSNPKHYRPLRL